MGNKDKKAAKNKAPFNSAEEAKTKIASLKETITTLREERKTFAQANGLTMKPLNFPDNAKHAKHGKTWTKMTEGINKIKAEIETAEAWVKENRPAGTNRVGVTKYTYPANCTTEAEKKKFRSAARTAAKKGAKAATKEAKVEGKNKKSAEADAPTKKSATAPVEKESTKVEGKKKNKKED